MKSIWNQEERCRVYTCHVCGHVYHDYYDDRRYQNKEKPFIETLDGVTVSIPRDYAPDKVEKITRYICPECGVVQVDVSSLD